MEGRTTWATGPTAAAYMGMLYHIARMEKLDGAYGLVLHIEMVVNHSIKGDSRHERIIFRNHKARGSSKTSSRPLTVTSKGCYKFQRVKKDYEL